MCSICGVSPCHTLCPNADEPESIGKCEECGDDIRVGDEFAEIGGALYCEGCLCDKTTKELVELCGGEWRTATDSDTDQGYYEERDYYDD